ncbi:hypothetical protein [Chromobacterium sp. CV08]|uniref:hypothetical protein n=1 Tax=Chromobacterium sp. CV08 TaxID=3133274 RepID=UPI003DA84E72
MNVKKLNIFDYNPFLLDEDRRNHADPLRAAKPILAGGAVLSHGSFVLIARLGGFAQLGRLVVRAFLRQDGRRLTARALVSEHHEHQDEKWHNGIIEQQDVLQDFGCYSSYIARPENIQWHETVLRHQSRWHGSLDMIRLVEFLKAGNPAMHAGAVQEAERDLRDWYRHAAGASRPETDDKRLLHV